MTVCLPFQASAVAEMPVKQDQAWQATHHTAGEHPASCPLAAKLDFHVPIAEWATLQHMLSGSPFCLVARAPYSMLSGSLYNAVTGTVHFTPRVSVQQPMPPTRHGLVSHAISEPTSLCHVELIAGLRHF